MGPSLQPPINRITPRRRFLESRNPSTGGRIVIKRSTTPEEASIPLNRAGTPAERTERSFSSLQNEALALGFLERYTKIPIPKVTAFFEDRSCLYLIQGYVEDAIPAIDTPSHLHPHITRQLERYMSQIHNIRSETLHSFTKEVHLPARLISTKAILCNLQYPQDPQSRYVLCHGDLGWQNVMVDPKTGDIKAIIDWEYSGFYPIEVEGDYWRRWWTARHRGYEISDVDQVSRLLYNLSTNKAFETGYALDRRINYVKKTKDQPAGEDEDRSHRWYRRLSTRLRKSDTDAAGKTTSPQGRSTFHVQNGEVDVQETTPNIPSGENETGQSSQPAKPTEESATSSARPEDGSTSLSNSQIDQRPEDVSDAPGWADLTVSHPKEDTVTARSLALQVAIASRENLAKRLVSLKRSLDIDYRATQDWTLAFTRDAPLYYKANLKRKTLLHELCRPFQVILQELQTGLLASIEPLRSFQEQDWKAQQYSEQIDRRRSEKLPENDSNGFDSLGWEATKFWNRMHSERDQAFRESETLKWGAIKRFANRLLIVANAAETLLPFIPDRVRNQSGRHLDPKRATAEDRVRNLLLGGSGGWIAEVKDMDDWVPLDPKELGVPDEMEDKSRDIAEHILKRYYDEDAQYLADFKAGSAAEPNT